MRKGSNRPYCDGDLTYMDMAAHSSNRILGERCKSKFTCNWNSACKALFLGLVLMLIGGSMATVGYFVDQIYTSTNNISGNDTVTAHEKARININSMSTYVGPMIMGVGGFIVVAACVMTFEQRDNAAKVVPNRLQLTTSSNMHSINRHSKTSPNSRQLVPFREGSARKHAPCQTTCTYDLSDAFCRRDLTADFIQFSRNLQQTSLKKKYGEHSLMNRYPSAPNLAASSLESLSFNKVSCESKLGRNPLLPLPGYSSLSPRMLQRQALSVDTRDYYTKNLSLPCSKHASRQGSTSTAGKGSSESLEVSSCNKKLRNSQTFTVLDLQLQSEYPISIRMKECKKRSDTARRHLLMRQTPIEYDDDLSYNRELRGSSQFHNLARSRYNSQSTSTPHSRRESYSTKVSAIETCSLNFSKQRESLLFGSSPPTLRRGGKYKYLRSNTISNEAMYRRRGSNTSDSSARKGSADYDNYIHGRKTSYTLDSCKCCITGDAPVSKDYDKSPTSSLNSFQELRLQSRNKNAKKREKLKYIASHGTDSSGSSKSRTASGRTTLQCGIENRSVSPDSLSVSSSATEGYSKAEHISLEMEEDSNKY